MEATLFQQYRIKAMLRNALYLNGMAIECYLKALHYSGNTPTEPKSIHKLTDLAIILPQKPTKRENKLLEKIEEVILWFGRYPKAKSKKEEIKELDELTYLEDKKGKSQQEDKRLKELEKKFLQASNKLMSLHELLDDQQEMKKFIKKLNSIWSSQLKAGEHKLYQPNDTPTLQPPT